MFWKWLNWVGINLGVSLRGIFPAEFLFPLCKFSEVNLSSWRQCILSMHNFTSMQSFYINGCFYTLCFFYCLVSITLVKVTGQNFYYKARINIRAIQIILCHCFYENYTSNIRFDLYLFKRAIFYVI